MRRTILALSAALLAGGIVAAEPASAERLKLSGSEIVRLLAGNSVEGDWKGTVFHAYFDPDGTAVFQRDGDQLQIGQWVARERFYCVTWNEPGEPAPQSQGLAAGFDMINLNARNDENCFSVYRNFNKVIWVEPETGISYSSKLVKGHAEDWQYVLPAQQANAQQ